MLNDQVLIEMKRPAVWGGPRDWCFAKKSLPVKASMVLRIGLLLLGCLILQDSLSPAVTFGASSDTSTDHKDQPWTFKTILGKSQKKQVKEIAADGKVLFEDGSTSSIDNFTHIETGNRLLGSDPTTKRFDLVYGGSIQARKFSLKEDFFEVETDLGNYLIPVESVQAIVLKARQGVKEQKALLETPSPDSDRVLVLTSKGPRSVSGLLEQLTEKKLAIDFQDKVREVDVSKVVAVYPAGAAGVGGTQKVKAPKFRLQLKDRSTLFAQQIAFKDGKWIATWQGNQNQLEVSDLVQVSIVSDWVHVVVDHPYKALPIETMISGKKETKKNLNVSGKTMRMLVKDQQSIVEKEFHEGFGTHSTSKIQFEIPEGFHTFVGSVGMDVSAGKRGICRCIIRIDGEEKFSQILKGGSPAELIKIPLSGRKVDVELVVLADQMMDLGDWVNWADLRLLKNEN